MLYFLYSPLQDIISLDDDVTSLPDPAENFQELLMRLFIYYCSEMQKQLCTEFVCVVTF